LSTLLEKYFQNYLNYFVFSVTICRKGDDGMKSGTLETIVWVMAFVLFVGGIILGDICSIETTSGYVSRETESLFNYAIMFYCWIFGFLFVVSGLSFSAILKHHENTDNFQKKMFNMFLEYQKDTEEWQLAMHKIIFSAIKDNENKTKND
jgi:hypothetical protein